MHAATALGGVSTHLTLGIHVWTRFALAQQLVHQALQTLADDPVMRASLPLGVEVANPAETRQDFDVVTALLTDAVEHADLDRMSESLSGAARSNQRAAPIGPLKQLRDADAMTVGTQLVFRQHLAASVDHTESRILVRSRAGGLEVAEDEVGRLNALLSNGMATAGDLRSGSGPAPAARRLGHRGVSQPDPAFRCSDAARVRADPLAGSAPPARRWLLLEHPGPWQTDAIAGAGIDPEVLATLVDKAGSATRILLIRRPGRIDRVLPGDGS